MNPTEYNFLINDATVEKISAQLPTQNESIINVGNCAEILPLCFSVLPRKRKIIAHRSFSSGTSNNFKLVSVTVSPLQQML